MLDVLYMHLGHGIEPHLVEILWVRLELVAGNSCNEAQIGLGVLPHALLQQVLAWGRVSALHAPPPSVPQLQGQMEQYLPVSLDPKALWTVSGLVGTDALECSDMHIQTLMQRHTGCVHMI